MDLRDPLFNKWHGCEDEKVLFRLRPDGGLNAMIKKTINYKKLVHHLLQNAENIVNNTNVSLEEFPAVITHYLQSDCMKLIYGNEVFQKNCHRAIHSFLGLSKSLFNKESNILVKPLNYEGIPFKPPKNPKFTFIDLFAGIGGFRIAFQDQGGKCVFSCEWDKYAQKTYFENFGEYPFGDVKQFTDPKRVPDDKILDELIPDHDILAGGFPCQPFSIAGVSKKQSLGRKHGFEDPTQGTLFFDIKRILRAKRPSAFFLENVKHLLRHDKGRTFEIIKYQLKKELGYTVRTNDIVVDGGNWRPQHRERVFIVGYNPDKIKISEEEIVIPKKPGARYKYTELRNIIENKVDDKYTLGKGTWETLVRHKRNHIKAGNGFGYGLIETPIEKDRRTRTISARYHKDGAEILIEQKDKPRPRRLTPLEGLKLQGFDVDKFILPVSDTQAYRQIGNSVVVPAVTATARKIVEILIERCNPNESKSAN